MTRTRLEQSIDALGSLLVVAAIHFAREVLGVSWAALYFGFGFVFVVRFLLYVREP